MYTYIKQAEATGISGHFFFRLVIAGTYNHFYIQKLNKNQTNRQKNQSPCIIIHIVGTGTNRRVTYYTANIPMYT